MTDVYEALCYIMPVFAISQNFEYSKITQRLTFCMWRSKNLWISLTYNEIRWSDQFKVTLYSIDAKLNPIVHRLLV